VRSDRYIKFITEDLSDGDVSLQATLLRKIEASASMNAPEEDRAVLARARGHSTSTSSAYYELAAVLRTQEKYAAAYLVKHSLVMMALPNTLHVSE